MKSYTDLEQSKKLAKILPLKSADMYYFCGDEDDICFGSGVYEEIADWHSNGTSKPADIPCWSLNALLEAMPEYIRKCDDRVYRNYYLNLYRSYYHCCSYSFGSTTRDDDDNILYCIGMENWIDACVEMILKLHEQNII